MRRVAIALLGAALASAAFASTPSLPAEPNRPWTPGPGEKLPPLPPPATQTLPPEAMQHGIRVSLAEVLDMALRNSPATRTSWLAARAALGELGSRRAEYLPKLNLTANLTRQQQAVGTGLIFHQTVYGPGADLTLLLLDVGGRSGDVEEARQLLLAADWRHNQTVQDLILRTEQAYYQYLAESSLNLALRADIDFARTSKEAAEARHHAGLATIADVLQATTLLEREQLALVQSDGRMKEIKGALATAVGLPPDLPVELGLLPADVPMQAAGEAVRAELDRALAERPDLQAARAEALAAAGHVRKIRGDGLPTLQLAGTTGRVYYERPSGLDPRNNYQLQLLLRFPLFTGFQNQSDLAQARAEAGQAQAQVDQLAQQVTVEVWTAYYELESAAKAVEAARALLTAAQASADVASGRYKEGVGSILDLLTAQSDLLTARAQEIGARADWFVAAAELSHATGLLGSPAPQAPTTQSAPEGTP